MARNTNTPNFNPDHTLSPIDLLGATVESGHRLSDELMKRGFVVPAVGTVVGYGTGTISVLWAAANHAGEQTTEAAHWGKDNRYDVKIIKRSGDVPATQTEAPGESPAPEPQQAEPIHRGDTVELISSYKLEWRARIGELAKVTGMWDNGNVVIKFTADGKKLITKKSNLRKVTPAGEMVQNPAPADAPAPEQGQADEEGLTGPEGTPEPMAGPQSAQDEAARQQGQCEGQRPPEGQLEEELAKVFLPRVEFKPGELIDAAAAKATDAARAVGNEVIAHVNKQVRLLAEDVEKQLALRATGGLTIQLANEAPRQLSGAVHFKMPSLIKAVNAGVPVMMVGPAGSGKSHSAHQCADALGLKYVCQSVCQQTTASLLMGYMDAQGNYVRSLFREAYEFGHLYCLDEGDAGNANVLASLNSALSNGVCAFPDAMVTRHANFRCVMTANTWGSGRTLEYVGRNPIDGATLDRFVAMGWDYDPAVEASMGNDEGWLEFVRLVRAEVAKRGIKHLVTPRAVLYGSKLLAAGIFPAEVAQLTVIKGLDLATVAAIRSALPTGMAREYFN
jgi:hypothetical protein